MGIILSPEALNRTKGQRKGEFALFELRHHLLLPSDISILGYLAFGLWITLIPLASWFLSLWTWTYITGSLSPWPSDSNWTQSTFLGVQQVGSRLWDSSDSVSVTWDNFHSISLYLYHLHLCIYICIYLYLYHLYHLFVYILLVCFSGEPWLIQWILGNTKQNISQNKLCWKMHIIHEGWVLKTKRCSP